MWLRQVIDAKSDAQLASSPESYDDTWLRNPIQSFPTIWVNLIYSPVIFFRRPRFLSAFHSDFTVLVEPSHLELMKNTYADSHLLPASLDGPTVHLPGTALPSRAAGAENFSKQQSYSVMEKRLNLCKQTDCSSLPALEVPVYPFTFPPLQTIHDRYTDPCKNKKRSNDEMRP